jgi:hypothetical protein
VPKSVGGRPFADDFRSNLGKKPCSMPSQPTSDTALSVKFGKRVRAFSFAARSCRRRCSCGCATRNAPGHIGGSSSAPVDANWPSCIVANGRTARSGPCPGRSGQRPSPGTAGSRASSGRAGGVRRAGRIGAGPRRSLLVAPTARMGRASASGRWSPHGRWRWWPQCGGEYLAGGVGSVSGRWDTSLGPPASSVRREFVPTWPLPVHRLGVCSRHFATKKGVANMAAAVMAIRTVVVRLGRGIDSAPLPWTKQAW